jgi:radical SAM protein with 4Fe4S-binding SPASM domain
MRVPRGVFWHLTSLCMADCRYCYLKRRRIPPDQLLSRQRMLELVQECRDLGVVHVEPLGGDVLLYPYLFDFLDAVEEGQFMPIQLSTKAYVSRDTARRLAQYTTIYQMQFSVDSTVDEVANYLTRTSGFRGRMLESIRHVREAGIPLHVKAVITPYNILTIPRLSRELYDAGVGSFRLHPYSRSGHHHTEDLFNHRESWSWLVEQMKRLEEKIPGKIFVYEEDPVATEPPSREILEKEWKDAPHCSGGRSSMMICADGKVIACEQLPETEEFFCGDVKTQSIQEVWNGAALNQQFVFFSREQFEGTPCRECPDFEACIPKRGYCFRDTYLFLGKVHTTPQKCPKYAGEFVRII